jgi:hypothetical protein
MEALADCPIDEPDVATTCRRLTHEESGRHALTADVFDDRLLASLIVRRVRRGRRAANASGHRARSIPTRSHPAGSPTTSSPLGPGAHPRARADDGGPEAVQTLFAELACRRLHTLVVEESRREWDQNSTDAS